MNGSIFNAGQSWPMEATVTNGLDMAGPQEDNLKKRKMSEDIQGLLDITNYNNIRPRTIVGSKSFLPLPKSERIFQTEDWKPKGASLFLPLVEDIMVNLKKMEQISFNHGTFFVADEKGNYSRTVNGQTLNLWRYSEEAHRLYISRCFLFTNQQDFTQIQNHLHTWL